MLPKKIQRLLSDNLYGVLDKYQTVQYRHDSACQFWVKSKTWQKVSYSQFRQADKGIAIYPKQVNTTTKYAGSPSSNTVKQTSPQDLSAANEASSQSINKNASSLAEAESAFMRQRAQMQKYNLAQSNTQNNVAPTYSPTLSIYKPEVNSTMLLKATHQVRQNFTNHLLQASENVEQLAQHYTGYKNANLIYDYNLGCSERNPAPAGTSLLVPNGWKLNVEGACTNSCSVHVQWQGPTNGDITLQLEKRRPDEFLFWQHYFVVEPGVYTVTANASGAVNTTTFTIEEPTFSYEIELLDDMDEPQANMGYNIRLTNGHVITGQLDQNGYANVSGPDFENAKVSFFELDDADWSVGNTT